MLYWTMIEKTGKVYLEADSRQAARDLAQAMANEVVGSAYSVEVNPVPEPETRTAVLIRRVGTREIVKFRAAESDEVRAVRRALESAA